MVAPYVGAWIETSLSQLNKNIVLSHPTWVRGLKQLQDKTMQTYCCRTLRGCVD